MDILVFKTNVSDKQHVEHVRPFLLGMQEIMKWNFDLLDEEFILRVEAIRHLNPQKVESALHNAGYYCKELESFCAGHSLQQ